MNDPDLLTTSLASEPITVMVTRVARPGMERELEEFVSGIVSAASRFEGLLAAMILRPSTPNGRIYRILARFDGEDSFKRWQESEERLYWIEREAALADKTHWEHQCGLETWFELPGHPMPTPPRYKVFLLSWAGAIPLYLLVNITLGNYFAPMPLLVRGPAYTALLLFFMTYLIMPFLSKRCYRWLHGTTRESF